MKKLNIGSGCVKGSVFEQGWTNVDFSFDASKCEWQSADYMKFDLTSVWPVPRDSVDCIYASHIFEHIEYSKIFHVICECHRVLIAGRPIRIICPDPRIFVRNWQIKNKQFILDCYGEQNHERWNYENQPHIAYTDMFFSDHYDHVLCSSISILMVMMIRAGFSKVSEMNYCNTEFSEFFGSYDNTLDNRPVMSYYLEGVK